MKGRRGKTVREVRPKDAAHHNRVRASEGGPADSERSFCAESSCAACKGAQRTVSTGGGEGRQVVNRRDILSCCASACS
jgi:hypothetical protein